MTISDLLELAVSAAPSGLLVFDPQGAILFANPMFEQMFGYAPGELRGTALDALVPEILESATRQGSRRSGTSRRLATHRRRCCCAAGAGTALDSRSTSGCCGPLSRDNPWSWVRS